MTENDPRYYLFKKLYLVRVNDLQRRSIEHVQAYGTLITGDKDQDQYASNQLVQCMLKVCDMAQYHAQGVNVYLCNPADSETIYRNIERHLSNWVEYLKHSLGVGSAPVDDLIMFDNFANAVFPHARRFFPDGKDSDAFTRAARGTLQFFKPEGLEKKKVVDEEEQPNRAGFGDILGEYKDIKDYQWR